VINNGDLASQFKELLWTVFFNQNGDKKNYLEPKTLNEFIWNSTENDKLEMKKYDLSPSDFQEMIEAVNFLKEQRSFAHPIIKLEENANWEIVEAHAQEVPEKCCSCSTGFEGCIRNFSQQ